MKKSIKWIVSVGLSGALVPVLQKGFNLIPWGKFVEVDNWRWLVEPKVSILSIIIFVSVLILVVRGTKRFYRGGQENYLKKLNSHIDAEHGIKITWDVGIGTIYNIDPFAYNIKMFCIKHGEVPLRMIHGCCPDSSCLNHRASLNEYLIKNKIESMLLHERDKLK